MAGDRGLDGVSVQRAVPAVLCGGRTSESSYVLCFRKSVDPSFGYPHRADGESGARHSPGAGVRGTGIKGQGDKHENKNKTVKKGDVGA